jgi:CHAT domain
MKKILILSANPKRTDKLRLDEEVRDIELGLERSRRRDQFEIKTKWAVRWEDVRRAMVDFEPQVVHFSGHGAGEDGLVMEDASGQMQLVTKDALSRLFRLFKNSTECVVLNACYSEVQARAIYEHIDCVIGMNSTVQDSAAKEFAVGFYDGLGAGYSSQRAFDLGCSGVLNDVEAAKPMLLIREQPEPHLSQEGHSSENPAVDQGEKSISINMHAGNNAKQIGSIEQIENMNL